MNRNPDLISGLPVLVQRSEKNGICCFDNLFMKEKTVQILPILFQKGFIGRKACLQKDVHSFWQRNFPENRPETKYPASALSQTVTGSVGKCRFGIEKIFV